MKILPAVLFLATLASAQLSPDQDEYAARRSKLMAVLPDGLILVYAREDAPQYMEGGFRQSATFFYLTGSDAFNVVLVLDAPRKDSRVIAKDALPALIARRSKEGVRAMYAASHVDDLAKQYPKIKWSSARTAIGDLRWVKSPSEIAKLRGAAVASVSALRAGMRAVRAGRTQREVEPEVVASCVANGAEGQSFWPWVMSGPNAVYPAMTKAWFDYRFLNRMIQPNDLVYLDLGCHYEHYEGDLGATIPVSGKFTAEQREVYDLLFDGLNATRAAIRPGATVATVKRAYYDVFRNAQGKTKSQLAADAVKSELAEEAEGKMFLVHGVGLDPVEQPEGPLVPGVVLALEPMIMLPEHKLGFQIEDMVVITEKGTELLSGGLPRSSAEVEAFLALPVKTSYAAIDVHNHMTPPSHTPERLISLMNVLGIAKSVVFGGPNNDYVLESADKYPDRLIPFYRATVREEQAAWLANDPKIYAELERQIVSGRWRGIGEFGNVHYPPWDNVRMYDKLLATEVSPLAPMVIRMFELADKHHLPVLMHNEVYYYKELDELLTRFPNVKLIWAHAGYTGYYGVDMLMKKHPNLYADLSIRALFRPRDQREASIFHSESKLKPEWIETIEKYPDRFMVGLDEYSNSYRSHEEYFAWTARLLAQLSATTARKVARENIEAVLASTSPR